MIQEIAYYANMTLGVYRLLRSPYRGGMEQLREQMEQREERFLENAERRVFSNPANPYHELFRMAGCSYGDLVAAVKGRGLEATLSQLAAEGVYLTHDEFKGKTPLVRAGREIPFTPQVLLNPASRGYIEGISSGSRSPGTPTRKSLELELYRDIHYALQTREFGLDGRVRALVGPLLPSSGALNNSIRQARAGGRIERWFAVRGSLRDSGHYRAATYFLVGLGRALGAPMPWPSYLPPNDFRPVAEWIAQLKREGRACAVRAFVSPAVRVAAAAREAGLDIAGTIFLVGGEALTDAKRAIIEASGCEVYPSYAITEVGGVGMACRQMKTGNCVHIRRDSVAVISRVRRAPLSDMEVNSLLFTNLLRFASRFLINAEMDDSGVIEPATCRCEYSAAGMTHAGAGHLQLREADGTGYYPFRFGCREHSGDGAAAALRRRSGRLSAC